MENSLDRYLREHCTLQCEALDWIQKQTNIRTNYPQMLSGKVQGGFLKMMVEASGARRILEIGTFTGYSTVCLALGLMGSGHIDALEINDELEGLIREGWERAGVSPLITLHLGDAIGILKSFSEHGSKEDHYDMVFIDANKREYDAYYEAVLPLVRRGGLILADDVLWDGKVYSDSPSSDPQTRSILAFNDKVASDPRVESLILPLRDGITIIRKL